MWRSICLGRAGTQLPLHMCLLRNMHEPCIIQKHMCAHLLMSKAALRMVYPVRLLVAAFTSAANMSAQQPRRLVSV